MKWPRSNQSQEYKGFSFWGKLTASKRNVVGLFVVAFGAIGGAILLFGSSAAPPAPTVYLSPATQTFATSTTFTVQIRENSGATPVNAVQANFSYPTGLVSFVSIDSTGSAFTTDAPSSGGSGQVSIARGVTGAGVTGDQLVATVTFQTLTTGGPATMAFVSGTALVATSNNQDILGSLSATGGGTYVIDTAPPTVTVTSPSSGASLSAGSVVPISITAVDADSSVTSVDVYIDGAKVTTLSAAPYNYNWNTTGLSLGTHTIQAKATDTFGNLGSSSVASVTLADTTPPTVSITGPSNNATVASTIVVSASATDNAGGTGVNKVEFYVDGVLKATDTSSPYSFNWNSTTALDGLRTLTAKAYDNASPANSATSSAITVRVDNTAPTTPGNFRATNTALTGIDLAWNASTDANGVTGYRIQRSGTTIATVAGNVLTYSDAGLIAGTNYVYTVSALDAAGNASPVATLNTATLTPKPGDLNGDNLVNITDLSIMLSHWNTNDANSDANHDGTVNIFDLSILLSHWGT